MKLMTKKLEERFKQVGRQENSKDPMVIAKFFNPAGGQTWFATEYAPKDRLFFGYVSLFGNYCDEFGYFSLTELEEVRVPVGIEINGERKGILPVEIERDLYFEEMPLSEALKKEGLHQSSFIA